MTQHPVDLPPQTRVADRVAGWFADADAFRREHPRLMRRLVRSHAEGESLEDFCANNAQSYAPFDSPAGLHLLLTREGVIAASKDVDELATFAFAQASRVQVLRAGVALRRVKTGDAPPA